MVIAGNPATSAWQIGTGGGGRVIMHCAHYSFLSYIPTETHPIDPTHTKIHAKLRRRDRCRLCFFFSPSSTAVDDITFFGSVPLLPGTSVVSFASFVERCRRPLPSPVSTDFLRWRRFSFPFSSSGSPLAGCHPSGIMDPPLPDVGALLFICCKLPRDSHQAFSAKQ